MPRTTTFLAQALVLFTCAASTVASSWDDARGSTSRKGGVFDSFYKPE
jgi:hypothetical protein